MARIDREDAMAMGFAPRVHPRALSGPVRTRDLDDDVASLFAPGDPTFWDDVARVRKILAGPIPPYQHPQCVLDLIAEAKRKPRAARVPREPKAPKALKAPKAPKQPKPRAPRKAKPTPAPAVLPVLAKDAIPAQIVGIPTILQRKTAKTGEMLVIEVRSATARYTGINVWAGYAQTLVAQAVNDGAVIGLTVRQPADPRWDPSVAFVKREVA